MAQIKADTLDTGEVLEIRKEPYYGRLGRVDEVDHRWVYMKLTHRKTRLRIPKKQADRYLSRIRS